MNIKRWENTPERKYPCFYVSLLSQLESISPLMLYRFQQGVLHSGSVLSTHSIDSEMSSSKPMFIFSLQVGTWGINPKPQNKGPNKQPPPEIPIMCLPPPKEKKNIILVTTTISTKAVVVSPNGHKKTLREMPSKEKAKPWSFYVCSFVRFNWDTWHHMHHRFQLNQKSSSFHVGKSGTRTLHVFRKWKTYAIPRYLFVKE